MSFEKFMSRVLQPAEVDDEPVSSQPPSQEMEPEAMSNEEFEKHLIERMNGLLEAATARKALGVFADVTVWKLAEVGHHCGQGAVGNIVRLFGGYLEQMVEAERGQREVDQARKDGHPPN